MPTLHAAPVRARAGPRFNIPIEAGGAEAGWGTTEIEPGEKCEPRNTHEGHPGPMRVVSGWVPQTRRATDPGLRGRVRCTVPNLHPRVSGGPGRARVSREAIPGGKNTRPAIPSVRHDVPHPPRVRGRPPACENPRGERGEPSFSPKLLGEYACAGRARGRRGRSWVGGKGESACARRFPVGRTHHARTHRAGACVFFEDLSGT